MLQAGCSAYGLTHFAISAGSEHEVDQLTERLRHEGVPIIENPRLNGDGYYESVVLDPEGNRIEITVRPALQQTVRS